MPNRWLRRASLPILLVASASALGQAADGDREAGFFAGVKLWANQWQIASVELNPVLLPNGAPGVQMVPRITVSDIKIVPLLTLGARFSKVIAAANVFPTAAYDSKGALDGDVSRSEYDLSVGYALLPNLIASIAYKEGRQSKIVNLPFSSAQKVRAGLLGLSAAAPLGANLFIYGNAAFGVGRQTSDSLNWEGDASYSTNYRIGEIGLSYRFHEGGPESKIRSTSVSIGYRTQVLVSKGLPFATLEASDPSGNPLQSASVVSVRNLDVQTTTDGFILSLIATF